MLRFMVGIGPKRSRSERPQRYEAPPVRTHRTGRVPCGPGRSRSGALALFRRCARRPSTCRCQVQWVRHLQRRASDRRPDHRRLEPCTSRPWISLWHGIARNLEGAWSGAWGCRRLSCLPLPPRGHVPHNSLPACIDCDVFDNHTLLPAVPISLQRLHLDGIGPGQLV